MTTVFFDVDTQLDFLSPGGALYAPGAEEIAAALGELTVLAGKRGFPIVSTLDSHIEDDPEFKIWKPHCVLGTQGHQKWSQSVLGRNSGQQIMFEKNKVEFFPNVELSGILDRLNADRFVVYGLITEYCVRVALFALLARGGARVELVTDAVKALSAAASETVLKEFQASGGFLTTVAAITG